MQITIEVVHTCERGAHKTWVHIHLEQFIQNKSMRVYQA